jgi:hypothetical protein
VEYSKFSRVELQIPKAPVHEKEGCVEGQTAISMKMFTYISTIFKLITCPKKKRSPRLSSSVRHPKEFEKRYKIQTPITNIHTNN